MRLISNQSLVIPIHSCHQTFGEEAENSFTHPGYDPGNGLFFARGETTKHIGNNVSFADFSRPSDAYPKTEKILTPQPGNDGINPFMTARATTLANTDFTQGEVKVIVNDDEIIEVDIELFYQPAN